VALWTAAPRSPWRARAGFAPASQILPVKTGHLAVIAKSDPRVRTQYTQLAQLRKLDAAGGTADPAAMLELQIRMQTASQYIEACSNVMSAIHSEMIGLARATKGR